MQVTYIAGAIFSATEWFLMCATAFLTVSLIVGLVIFVSKKLYSKAAKTPGKNLAPLPSLLIGLVIVSLAFLLFIFLPTAFENQQQANNEQTCAKKVGYSSPSDDNSARATAETQSTYRKCLGQ
jgi:hypothetical protein